MTETNTNYTQNVHIIVLRSVGYIYLSKLMLVYSH